MIGCLARINENVLNVQEKGMFLGEKRGQCFGHIYIYIYTYLHVVLTESLLWCKPCGKYSICSISFNPYYHSRK